MLKMINVSTSSRQQMVDVTSQVNKILRESGIKNGIITLFVPHTTAAVTINENADPTVPRDMLFSLEKISPIYKEFRHLEGNSDAHVKSSLIGCDQQIIVENGQLVLGTWQDIYFCEFDGPRNRKLYIKILGN
ncbi:MAG: secondary thiamine-phosphate synthase enzyme YjbQ [Candidatus Cloacimonetes bacterium]|nr:secondary thiamine-phosphate synthase enzyme YjbQ [Candidatus Cloacimonadota bacterium]MCF7813395.1 secondary thiamine-phosphate synthase enzyme YjbQ [Candidatus Cloacimonadota bacterium]MCF7867480.1 secondary thiamine-phosphate synthase enzyme YjbQ [Candidatus Cloacimonadota bacterium]MCF7883017.1 secondary thiamine-phosphate synthase enzyme YjbQ [Candidatus Cloacimonadota bacterium]